MIGLILTIIIVTMGFVTGEMIDDTWRDSLGDEKTSEIYPEDQARQARCKF